MTTAPARPSILVAGIGNIFFGDDGFGSSVAQRLRSLCTLLPAHTRVEDFGIRSLHLAFELLDPPDLLILVDATSRGGSPGSLYLIDPAITETDDDDDVEVISNAHAMNADTVLANVRRMNGALPKKTRIVGCEPADVSERMELTDVVRNAVDPAIAMIRELIEQEQQTQKSGEVSS